MARGCRPPPRARRGYGHALRFAASMLRVLTGGCVCARRPPRARAAPRPQDLEVSRVMHHLRLLPDTLQKYVLLSWLKESNEELFFAVNAAYTTETMPLVYTPVVRVRVRVRVN